MRHVYVAAMLFPAAVSAAPVKIDPKAERAKLESLWKDLQSYDAVDLARAALELSEHPRTVPFLKEKLPPVAATKEETTARLKDLNGVDEKVREQAYEELKYFDPRLALTIDEALVAVTDFRSRAQLVGILSGYKLDRSAEYGPLIDASVQVKKVSDEGTEVLYRQTYGIQARAVSITFGLNFPSVAKVQSRTWNNAALAALVLERVGTPAATAVLERLSAGHPDALPTRTAVAHLQPGPPAPLTAKRLDVVWGELAGRDAGAIVRGMFTLLENPKAVEQLKAKLPAIRADKTQLKKWLADLGSEDEKVWKPACESLRLFHPSLGLTVAEQIAAADNDRSRSRLMLRVWFDSEDDRVYTDCTLEDHDGELQYHFSNGGRQQTFRATVQPLTELQPAAWARARLAVLVLERIKSPEAVAALKQLADGHPDIRPTKDAKAALERLGK